MFKLNVACLCVICSLALAGCKTNSDAVTTDVSVVKNNFGEIYRHQTEYNKKIVSSYFVDTRSSKTLDEIKKLIALGVNVDTLNEDGNTALMNAVEAGQADIVSYLLENHANVNVINKKDQSALDLAVMGGNEEIAKMIIEHGGNIWQRPNSEFSPLRLAVDKSNLEIAKMIIENRDRLYQSNPEMVQNSEYKLINKGFLCEPLKNEFEGQFLWHGNVDEPLEGRYYALEDYNQTEVDKYVDALKYVVANVDEIKLNLDDNECIYNNYIIFNDKNVIHKLGCDDLCIQNAFKLLATEFIRRIENTESEISRIESFDPLDCSINDYESIKKLYERQLEQIKSLGVTIPSDSSVSKEDSSEPEKRSLATSKTKAKPSLFGNTDKVEGMDHGAWHETDEETIEHLLKLGADINERDEYGNTPIFYVEAPETISFLVERGAKVNIKNKNGRTPLMVYDELDMTEAFVKAGAKVNAKDNEGRTALFSLFDSSSKNDHSAGLIGDTYSAADPTEEESARDHIDSQTETLKFLLKNGLNINEKDHYGKTALFYVENPYAISVLRAMGANVNEVDASGKTALMLADSPDAIRALIAEGADLSMKDLDGKTALDLHENSDEISKILKHPLHFVATAPASTVQKLIQLGYDVNERDENGNTPLHSVCVVRMDQGTVNEEGKIIDFDNRMIANTLIAMGADVNAQNNLGQTPLMLCVGNNQPAVETLIAANADLNIVDSMGRNALSYAFLDKENKNYNWYDYSISTYSVYHQELVLKLVSAGIDVNSKDENGRTALMHSIFDEKLFDALLSAGADVTLTDKDGRNAASYLMLSEDYREYDYYSARTHLVPKYLQKMEQYQNEHFSKLMNKGASVASFDSKHNSLILSFLMNAYTGAYFRNNWSRNPEEHLKNINDYVLSIIDLLVKNGADVNAFNLDGTSPLNLAVQNNDTDTVDGLISLGADVNSQNEAGKTALMFANSIKLVEKLIELKANILVTDKEGKRAIDYMTASVLVNALLYPYSCDVMNLSEDALDNIKSQGFDVNMKNAFGDTPLHIAARKGNSTYIRWLIANGANIDLVNFEGKKASEVAAQSLEPDIVSLLNK